MRWRNRSDGAELQHHWGDRALTWHVSATIIVFEVMLRWDQGEMVQGMAQNRSITGGRGC